MIFMVQEIPDDIYDFVCKTVVTYGDVKISMKDIHDRNVFGNSQHGSGFCIKYGVKAINHKDAGANKVLVEFTISDGEYSVRCISHNADENYLSGSLEDEAIADMLQIISRSQKEGKRVELRGHYINMGTKRLFLVDTIELDDGFQESQMTTPQFKEFKGLCNKYDMTPLDLMMRDDTLWAELYAMDFLKKAVLLFCLSPKRKQDMIHVGIVSSHGEGKDHLIERVIQPLVPCRRAGSGKMATIPGLFGAMSGDDLNAIEIGLLPKMNHERVAISEFQTWGDETFGELMNMMANGQIEMQKGALDIERETTLNLLFLGNPPNYYTEDMDKRVMLDAFGKYTFQIISRLTLIFTQLSLSDGKASQRIRDAIISSMDGDFEESEIAERVAKWRKFFREYLRYVSHMTPKLKDYSGSINGTYDDLEQKPQFKDAFCIRTATDNRKYQEFANLVRGFARLMGDDAINFTHVMSAAQIFELSLETLTEKFPTKAWANGVDENLLKLYDCILEKCPVGHNKREIQKECNISNDDLTTLTKLKALTRFDDGTYFVNADWKEGLEI
tara:strand:+ start:2176 stop:3849 length:1674 start_codon:yes stop_codon:yes gene_type:complete